MTAAPSAGREQGHGRSSRFRIVHVTAPGAVGGLESVVRALTAGLRRRGHDVTLVACLHGNEDAGPFLGAVRADGVTVRTLVHGGRAYRAERAAIRRALTDLRPQVVHSHGFRADLQASSAARGLPTATVSTTHGFTGGSWKVRFYEALQVRRLRRFDRVIAVSRPLAETLRARRVPAERIATIPNAWTGGATILSRTDARAALGLPEAGRVVGWVGRFGREKAPDLFVDALAALPGDVRAVMIGDGPLFDSVRERAGAAGIADRLSLPGVIPDAARLLRAFDVIALSSHTEGTPIVLLEAMAARVPVVATNVGGVPDVLGEAGVTVPSGDPGALAAAIGRTLDTPEAAAERARQASARLDREFGEDAWLDAHEAAYAAAIARAGVS